MLTQLTKALWQALLAVYPTSISLCSFCNKDLVFLGCEHAQMNEYTLLQLSVAMGEASGSHRPDLL